MIAWSRNYCIDFYQILLNNKHQQVLVAGCAPRAKSAIYNILVVGVVIYSCWRKTCVLEHLHSKYMWICLRYNNYKHVTDNSLCL